MSRGGHWQGGVVLGVYCPDGENVPVFLSGGLCHDTASLVSTKVTGEPRYNLYSGIQKCLLTYYLLFIAVCVSALDLSLKQTGVVEL